MSQECPSALAPDTLNCSGRGIACFSQQCICEEGWIGQGDFVAGSPACQLNVVAVRALWSIVSAAHVFSLFFCFRFIHRRIKEGSTRYTDSPFLAALNGTLASASLIPLGLLRAIDPKRTIGTDPAATVFLCLASFGFWSFAPLLGYSYLKLSALSIRTQNEDERKKMNALLQGLRKTLPVNWILTAIASFCPLFMLINPLNQGLVFGLAACHYIIIGFVEIFFFLSVRAVIKPILRDIKDVVAIRPSPSLSKIAQKIERLSVEVRNQTVLQAVAAAVFGCWPFAQRFATYELSLAWLGSAFLIGVGLNTLLPTSTKTSDTNSGLESNRTLLTSAVSGRNMGMPSPRQEENKQALVPNVSPGAS